MLSSIALAGPAMAAPPAAGTNCIAADGKINGRGATFQTNVQVALMAGYTADVCGPVAADAGADTGMINYNNATIDGVNQGVYPVLAGTGSGNGIKALNCRTDAFMGTDVPYTLSDLTGKTTAPFTTLTALRGPKPPQVTTYTAAGLPEPQAPNNLLTAGTPCAAQQPNQAPYPPNTPNNYPAAADAGAGNNRPISFPIAGAAVALGVRLDPGVNGCPNPIPDINLTSAQVSQLFGGQSGGPPTNWSSIIPGCNVPVRRVVRADSSGTTTIFKSYLRNARTAADVLCDASLPAGVTANNWESPGGYFDVNQAWPGSDDPNCSLLAPATGAPAIVTSVAGTNGSIGYADMADWAGTTGLPAGVTLANVDSTSGAPQSPGSIGAGTPPTISSNCNFGALPQPAGGQSSAISQNPNPLQSWASNGGTFPSGRSFQDTTFQGDGYPICGITFMGTWAGLSGPTGTGAVAALTNNQRRTLYSYMVYITSPAAQARLAGAGYNPIRQSLLNQVRTGLQAPVGLTGGF